MAGVELDSGELGTEYRARFKRIEVPDGQDWKINISIPTREKSISKDSLEFIQLTRKDSEGYYLLEITPKLKGTWRYQVMSEYQDESGEYHLLMMRDTMRFVCY
jgi:hypothetical protein